MISFTNHHLAGAIPSFLSEDDPRPAALQINERYIYGGPDGGWNSFPGFKLLRPMSADGPFRLAYAGDPDRREKCRAKLRDETIILFESDWVAIIQPDGSYDVARID